MDEIHVILILILIFIGILAFMVSKLIVEVLDMKYNGISESRKIEIPKDSIQKIVRLVIDELEARN